MNVPLVLAGCLAITLGLVHSAVGELRLLPELAQKRGIASEPLVSARQLGVLRGTWHTLSPFGFGLGALLLTLAIPALGKHCETVAVIASACALTGAYWAYATRFWHLAWIAFMLIAALCWWA